MLATPKRTLPPPTVENERNDVAFHQIKSYNYYSPKKRGNSKIILESDFYIYFKNGKKKEW